MTPEEQRPFQFRLRTLFLIIAGVASAIWVAGNLVVAVWDGRFDLTLNISSRSSQGIESISYATFYKREIARIVAKDYDAVQKVGFDPVIEDGGRILAHIPCSGRTNQFGHDTSYVEQRYVVLRIQYTDGQEHRTLVEVPRGRGPRSVTVVIP